MIVVIISGIVVLTGGLLLVRANRRVPLNYSGYDELFVTSPSFVDGIIPEQFTGNGEDRSPQLVFANLSEEAVSIAVIMDDLDVPIVGVYNHWTIWNIPPQNLIPEGIPHGGHRWGTGRRCSGSRLWTSPLPGTKAAFWKPSLSISCFCAGYHAGFESCLQKKRVVSCHGWAYFAVWVGYRGVSKWKKGIAQKLSNRIA